MGAIQTFVRKKEFLIGIDSDGCAMDTMNCKHFNCFGPCMVEEWKLNQWREPILRRWNEINLYTMTRGINRFKGLVLALEEIQQRYCPIEDLDSLKRWAETADELSNESVKRAAKETGSQALQKAYAWSQAVNHAITLIPEAQKQPFDGVKEVLKVAHEKADIAIISSANQEAVREEWSQHGLMEFADIMLTQEMGSKEFCIGEMLKKGYVHNQVLMVGDAPGDKKAAETNGILFYPVLVRRETQSWRLLLEEGLSRFWNLSYEGSWEEKLKKAFIDNLS